MQFAAEDQHRLLLPISLLLRRENRARLWVGAAVVSLILVLLLAPRIPHSPSLHIFADMRNFLGVPNTLNVLTSFPFLLVGVPSLVLCLSGSCFGISLKGEVLGWALFYAGNAALAFGSAYYHLKPDDDRIAWDRTFNDLRLCMVFHVFPCIAIPAMVFLLPPKYTHSRFWILATGFYLLARFEGIADKKVYSVNRYFISGHSLEHLFLAMVSIILTVMLCLRSIKIARDC